MPPDATEARQAELFHALGDPMRLRLLARLAQAEASISELAAGPDMTLQAVTKHLRVLKSAGLVVPERMGREYVYRLDTRPLDLGRTFLEQFSGHWEHALAGLNALVDNIPE
jgi:DNA-binding transcriptional ArsR family regulator